MSDIKRIQLTAVPATQHEKKTKRKTKTFRFELSLGESNAETCPEYSFAELIKNEKTAVDDDPFNDGVDDREVAAIAQRFEAKYGPKSANSGKKKRTQSMDDYYDLGDGYDVDDPFIDNTEAYDEVIPSTMTTRHGGFYINQGQLDFRSLSDDSHQVFASPNSTPVAKKKKKKKGVLNSDSEEENGEALVKMYKAMKRKKRLDLESKALEKKKKKLSDGSDGEPIKKIRKKNPLKLKKKLSRQREAFTEPAAPSSPGKIPTPMATNSAAIPDTSTSATSTATSATSGVETAASSYVSGSIVTTAAATFQAATSTTIIKLTAPSTTETMANGISSNKQEGLTKPGVDSQEEKSETFSQDVMKDESSSKSGDEAKGEQQAGDKNTQLPSQLPAELLNSIESIKKYAKENTEGNRKFFSPEINKLLLDIELGSYGLAWGSRTAIFGHLGEHLPCGKPALQRRAKKLREEDLLQEPIQRLKKAIDAVMPGLQEQHNQEVLKAKSEAKKANATDGPKEEASTESEEDETKQDTTSKKPKRPKRKFQWTTETRQCLVEIVSLKLKAFKSRNQTEEEYIKAFLESAIKPLWPAGWMTTRILLKESKVCREDLDKTGNPQQGKEKSVSHVGKSPPSVFTAANVTSSAANVSPSQPHVCKTEDVVEISGPDRSETEPTSKDVERKGAPGASDTVVIHLPGSTNVASSPRSNVPSSTHPKLSLPPVEVIDITDSPVKPASLPLPGSSVDKFLTSQKKGQQPQQQKTSPQFQPQWAHSPHLSQSSLIQREKTQQQQQQQQRKQPPHSVSTLSVPSKLQPSATQAISGATKLADNSNPGYANNPHSMYLPFVVVKPVSLGPGQQQHKVTATKSLIQSSPNVTSPVSISTKSVNLAHGQTKPAHLISTPVSFSQNTSAQACLGQGGSDSSKFSQQRKVQAGLGSDSSPLLQAGTMSRNGAQQLKAVTILGTSTSHSSDRLQYTQAGNRANNPQPYRSQQSNMGLNTGHSRSDQPGIAPKLSPHSGMASFKSVEARQGASRTMQQGGDASSLRQAQKTSPGSSRPSAQLGSRVSSPSPTKQPFQPEQLSPSSRGSNSCSPQQQASPREASTKMSLFEQLQSQIRSQDAVEGQALKILAMARNLQGTESFSEGESQPKPLSPFVRMQEPLSTKPSVISSSDSREHSGTKIQPAPYEDLLKLRESMGCRAKGGASLQSSKIGSGSSSPRQAGQSQISPKIKSPLMGPADAARLVPTAKPQQRVISKDQKNIFAELQKSVHSTEKPTHAGSKSYSSPPFAPPKPAVHQGSLPGNKELSLNQGLAVTQESGGFVFTGLVQNEASLSIEGNNLAKSILKAGSIGKVCSQPQIYMANQIKESPPCMPHSKNQAQSGGLNTSQQ
ncbi:ubinuclein-2 [Plakobranchus ocellatus]|uniref:Ubinuclein-2 n=1 Tax=Plakobranchus ocellatus TaxID=259542 RepID=A0AAV3Y7G3_9GAST|nr:ubinuclein-2 [Plakobranchus ocellatus]